MNLGMNEIARLIIIAGLGLTAAGLMFLFLSKIPGGKLPGDILIKREDFTFYFPLTTCIVVSILASVLMHLFRK